MRKPFIALLLALSLLLAACGSSKSSSSSTTSATTTSTTASTQAGGSSSVTTGPVRGTLRGQNHAPKVNQNWRYWVTATDATGGGLSGTVDIQFMYAGQVVGRDTPPTHPVKNGQWHDTITFPPPSVGMPLSFRAVLHTRLGSITLDWPITVRR